tara:strand:- start:601 stop:864 length:264 start_codon:yes stop_codon:yes gene_type:complete
MESHNVPTPSPDLPIGQTLELICRDIRLEQLIEKLQSEVAELKNQLSYRDEAIDSLRKEVQQLTKRDRKPKRVSSNYPKYKKDRSDS